MLTSTLIFPFGKKFPLRDLISRLLVKDPKKRFTAKQCQASPWFKETTLQLDTFVLRSFSTEFEKGGDFARLVRTAWQHFDSNLDEKLSQQEAMNFLRDSVCLLTQFGTQQSIATAKEIIRNQSSCMVCIKQVYSYLDSSNSGFIIWSSFLNKLKTFE